MIKFFSSQSDIIGSPDAGCARSNFLLRAIAPVVFASDRDATSARSLPTLPEAV